MPELFSLIEEKEVNKERLRTYSINFNFTFNELEINQITIPTIPERKKAEKRLPKN